VRKGVSMFSWLKTKFESSTATVNESSSGDGRILPYEKDRGPETRGDWADNENDPLWSISEIDSRGDSSGRKDHARDKTEFEAMASNELITAELTQKNGETLLANAQVELETAAAKLKILTKAHNDCIDEREKAHDGSVRAESDCRILEAKASEANRSAMIIAKKADAAIARSRDSVRTAKVKAKALMKASVFEAKNKASKIKVESKTEIHEARGLARKVRGEAKEARLSAKRMALELKNRRAAEITSSQEKAEAENTKTRLEAKLVRAETTALKVRSEAKAAQALLKKTRADAEIAVQKILKARAETEIERIQERRKGFEAAAAKAVSEAEAIAKSVAEEKRMAELAAVQAEEAIAKANEIIEKSRNEADEAIRETEMAKAETVKAEAEVRAVREEVMKAMGVAEAHKLEAEAAKADAIKMKYEVGKAKTGLPVPDIENRPPEHPGEDARNHHTAGVFLNDSRKKAGHRNRGETQALESGHGVTSMDPVTGSPNPHSSTDAENPSSTMVIGVPSQKANTRAKALQVLDELEERIGGSTKDLKKGSKKKVSNAFENKERRQHHRIMYNMGEGPRVRVNNNLLPVTDLSSRGMRVRNEGKVKFGKLLRGTLIFPDGATMKVIGKIIRKSKLDLGCQLVTHIANTVINMRQPGNNMDAEKKSQNSEYMRLVKR
jgi:hypothetical protein